MWLFRVFSSTVFLAVTVSSIPLAFDVGGKTCGLAFSLSLATFYFLFSLLRLTTPERSWVRGSLVAIIRSTQWILIPILLIWSLNRFSAETDNSSGWVERTFSGKRAQDSSVQEWLFGRDGLVEAVSLGNWDRLLRWSTPVFQLAEGFCSLLVIQAAGQITRWLVNRGGRSDSWMVSECTFVFRKPWRKLTPLLDWPSRPLRDRDLELGVLPLARPPVPGDLQRGRGVDRCLNHLRSHPVRLGDWQRARKPRRELSALRLRGSLHLPDIHRLQAILSSRADPFPHASRRFSSAPPDLHGIVYHSDACLVAPTVHHPRGLQRDHRRLQRGHSLRPHLPRIPASCVVCLNAHHPSGA